jgi:pimeloyl-ACP methyl ester carboxylesterase
MTHWLLLRGLSRESRHWNPFPAHFEEALPGARVHTLDLPGAGTEWRRPSPLSIAEIVRDVRARWLPLRDAHPGPWALMGISLGGMVTLQWVADFPHDFSRAIVVNTSAGDLSPPWHRMDLSVLPDIVRALRTRDPVARERYVLRATTRVFRDHEPLAARWADYHREHPMTRVNVLRQLAAASRFRSPARLEVPLMVLCAARDPLARPECGRRIAEKYRARYELHPSGGHDLPLDDPHWITERVAHFAG